MLRNSIKLSCSVIIVILLLFIPLTSYAVPPVCIDGYFEDWVKPPHQGLYFLPYYNDGKGCTSISLLNYGSKLYGHVKMNVQIRRFETRYMYLIFDNSYLIQYSILKKGSIPGHIKDMPVGIYTDLAIYVTAIGPASALKTNTDGSVSVDFNYLTPKQPYEYAGEAALQVYDNCVNSGDEVEFYIDYSHLNNFSFNQIKFYVPTYGGQYFILCGTSTGPIIGIIISLLTIGIVLLYRKHRLKRKKESSERMIVC